MSGMTAGTPTDLTWQRRVWRNRVAFVSLIGFTIAVAAATFALSFYGLNDYGRRVMALPSQLSWLVPIGVDLFSMCGISATYMLRTAPVRVRLYAWSVFLVPTALSVAGNLAHAEHRGLTRAGMAGAAVVPAILALATHLVVVVRRYVDPTASDTGPDTAAAVNERLVAADLAAAEGEADGDFLDDTDFDTPEDSADDFEPDIEVEQTGASDGADDFVLMAARDTTADTHAGMPLTLPPAGVKVVRAHVKWPKLTNVELAKRARVSVSSVNRYRPARNSATDPDIETVNGRTPALTPGGTS